MEPRIVMNLPYPEARVVVAQVERQLGIPIRAVSAVLDEAVETIRDLVADGQVDGVISRGITYPMLLDVVDVPVVSMHMTDFDVMRALWRARRLGERIAVVAFRHREYDYMFEELNEMLGTKVNRYYFSDVPQISAAMEQASAEGVEVIVIGAQYGVDLAREKGLHGVLVEMSPRSLAQAVHRVLEAIRLRRRDARELDRLRAVSNTVSEGLLVVDHHGRVILGNRKATELLRVGPEDLSGRTLAELHLPADAGQVLGPGESRHQVLRLRDSQLSIHMEYMDLGDERSGTVITINDISRIQHLEQEIRQGLYQKGLVAKFCFDDIVAQSGPMRRVIELARKYSATDSTVLIHGESGTGKEMLAQSMHRANPRRSRGPFVAINCSALPDNLLESELFGYADGAFTGARKGGRPGLFELAHNGTIFLDEIGSISPRLQMRLLRVLQEREVMRVGGDRMIPVDVWAIAATNVDLREEVRQGRFRPDLFFRLDVLPLRVPPLRQRLEDIPLLIEHLVQKYGEKYRSRLPAFPAPLLDACLRYDWPGNVRELENTVQRWVILAAVSDDVETAVAEVWPAELQAGEAGDGNACLQVALVPGSLEEMMQQVVRVLQNRYASRKELAAALGVSRTTLWRLLQPRQ